MAAWASQEVDTEPGLSAGFASSFQRVMKLRFRSGAPIRGGALRAAVGAGARGAALFRGTAAAIRGGAAALAFLAVATAAAEPLELSRQLVLAAPPPVAETTPAPALPSLRRGSKGPAVGRLTDYLVRAGLSSFRPAEPEVFGAEHEYAVRLLQRHFGLPEDGIAGPLLYANLAADLGRRSAAVEAFAFRLEALAHQARSEGRRKMIVVNVPSFTLRAIDLESGRTVVESPVVVGRRDRPTPVGRFNLISLKYNPGWNPPPVVVGRDIVPRLEGGEKARKWFDKYRLVGVGPDGATKPAHEVTRAEFEAGWKFRQQPGREGALGVLKFETDSKDHIYLHDTNERGLFSKALRGQSSGCIRVQKWLQLAAFVADAGEDAIRENVDKAVTHWQKIGKVPVFVEYSLGDVVGGKAVAYPDLYGGEAPPSTPRK